MLGELEPYAQCVNRTVSTFVSHLEYGHSERLCRKHAHVVGLAQQRVDGCTPPTHPLSHHTLTHSGNLGLGSLAPEMESAVLGVAMEALEEDFGEARRLFDGTWASRCVTCNLWVRDFRQYRRHVDHCPKTSKEKSGAFEEGEEFD